MRCWGLVPKTGSSSARLIIIVLDFYPGDSHTQLVLTETRPRPALMDMVSQPAGASFLNSSGSLFASIKHGPAKMVSGRLVLMEEHPVRDTACL